jgi:cell wall-associated NlpC family hydrolase
MLRSFIMAVLAGLGLQGTPNQVAFFTGLAAAEGTEARNNPFATSYILGRGETKFNSHGVKNYLSPEDGVRATVETFRLRYYKKVMRLLKADAPVADVAKALSQSPYVGGSQSVRDAHARNITRNSQRADFESPALTGPVNVQQASSTYATENAQTRAQRIIDLAKQYQGTAYTWGGASPDGGFDCSGFTKWLLERNGFENIPHYAADQFRLGQNVDKNALKPGDLVFFNMKKDGPGHMGLYIGNGQFIHASGSQSRQGTGADRGVKVSNLNDGWYARNYVGARRLADMGNADILDDPQANQQVLTVEEQPRVIFPFEDPTWQSPFPEPGSVDIPSPDTNPFETWKLINSLPSADPDTSRYTSLVEFAQQVPTGGVA